MNSLNNLQSSMDQIDRFLESPLETPSVGLLSMDQDLNIIFCNPAAELIFASPSKELIGKPLKELFPENFHDLPQSILNRGVNGDKKMSSLEEHAFMIGLRNDGSEISAEVSISRIVYQGQVSFSAVIHNTSILLQRISLLEKQVEEFASLPDDFIKSWLNMLGFKDRGAVDHTMRVTEMTIKLAEKLRIEPAEIVHIRRGALLHDIGKVNVPDKILQKPGKLNEKELAIVRKHPLYAYEVLSQLPYLRQSLNIPFCHHEKWDGSGYPYGLKEKQIPLAARIFTIVDVWDALSSDRPYRKAWTKRKVHRYLRQQSGKHFDPRVTETFLKDILS